MDNPQKRFTNFIVPGFSIEKITKIHEFCHVVMTTLAIIGN
jgi:hypothetical protein